MAANRDIHSLQEERKRQSELDQKTVQVCALLRRHLTAAHPLQLQQSQSQVEQLLLTIQEERRRNEDARKRLETEFEEKKKKQQKDAQLCVVCLEEPAEWCCLDCMHV